ncbi:MAG: hypothetical protein OZ913_06240 [Ignavibacteriaceae bacterium]|jgi:hypothetical protein|nr:MAG: hypothetical protein UZ04_CHB001002117 [Chlorobi bacterium OLB4]MBW7856581.1 hypothetical protein [Ignavibacteria bacterium]MEB2329886.1 hypothetical protein [Ignavibacteriaceae bacterium]OQY77501.1 MAG: hypothetical protein B6D43_06265 [Ignavibacteriales bacterium UTCHB1]
MGKGILSIFIFLQSVFVYSQTTTTPDTEKKFYTGFGTSVSSYLGEDFGSRYSIRSFFNNYDSYYNQSYNSNPAFGVFPLNLQFNFGYRFNDKIATELETSFIWHARGYMTNPDFQTGTLSGGRYYSDRYDYSSMMAVPLFINMKYSPFGEYYNSLIFKTGFGFQYVSESIDRVRKIYEESYYYTYFTEYLLGTTTASKFMPGIKIGAGYLGEIGDGFLNETDITYTLFFNNNKISGNPLAINTSGKIGMISLNTRIYLVF